MNDTDRLRIQRRFELLQGDICAGLEQLDGSGRFSEDIWERPGGGGGRSRIIAGKLIEKGGVGFSAVHGVVPDKMATILQADVDEKFFATGVSIVLHPHNPWLPIIHMNVRYFEMDNGNYWFGGGIDLTPHYIFAEEAIHFHKQLKEICDRFEPDAYLKFKATADDYFYIPHRKETRGVGGIFFDHLKARDGMTKSQIEDFVFSVGNAFVSIYQNAVENNRDRAFIEEQIQWQRLRRGRYAEFNLVYDRGTKFGLETDGRAESILMSLPPLAAWEYNHQVQNGSLEQFTLEHLRKGIDWINYSLAD
ncbi:MAG: oxygen-dependent coproporphyrinogen oxidase [Saprospiraceae bacterium]